ncbi:hypothetical protein PENARI_c103G06842 [Penicillium arizonense]|uniref:Uncharacterized protein n=1 Tax=Penicillium arizonense TaxID=1835702 RepID=A0A1F5L0V0_PENAI|nr:hypothetical protein PENARI_c144G12042 [Penicillium arizonense]XP_022482292.1 hypothetical protein PENARI_c103G06842 [Penicillium arizonense]OGE46669.1 hypothetical protein PENARI_c144G12042 [Penicillium arizonense]OGE46825.1 hypothetical protein PENARI_c103G06842 [Penicillium arizonense]
MGLRETQAADVFITQRWIQNRVWLLCVYHGFLRSYSERPDLTFGYSVFIAKSTLQLRRSLKLSSMEAHGIEFSEKLYNTAVSATDILCNIISPYGTGMAPLAKFTDSIPTTQFKAHLHSLQIPSSKIATWATQ